MRTPIYYFPRNKTRAAVLAEILALRDRTFDRVKHAMHRVRWVSTSARAGYWTDTP